ncbi:AAA family ATPase [Heyndrickxia camelliae]|uniref:ATP-binding protein n=1 Tax=Heyndrickxia camelliae TaxID=1707093 RepID=A0A2N3LJC7_9BACI|nr:AAA family ATPase [Heyndrickxia camelliae]PKR84649.1 ATP-binding protein [Heyndrickxia camelliae]
MFFLQMSGVPGSGKSTLARQIGKATGAIVIDHDIVKSALLKSLDARNLDVRTTGSVSYDIEWALIDFYLSQGHCVIFDSPCFYQEMLEKGQGLSKKHQANYKYIECYLDDYIEINKRLKTRQRMISQIQEVESEEMLQASIYNSKRPQDTAFIKVDTSRPNQYYIEDVINYLQE